MMKTHKNTLQQIAFRYIFPILNNLYIQMLIEPTLASAFWAIKILQQKKKKNITRISLMFFRIFLAAALA